MPKLTDPAGFPTQVDAEADTRLDATLHVHSDEGVSPDTSGSEDFAAMTVAELDEYAAANNLSDYPSSGVKADKVSFLQGL